MLGFLYGQAMRVRNRLYESGRLASFDLGAPTISIGNITAGGTGKTPLVAKVAGILADAGRSVCVISRGYGRRDERSRVLVSDSRSVLADAGEAGDEPVELARLLIGKAVVVADADRAAAAGWAMAEFRPDVFVLDDAFQHRRARRNLDVVTIDATAPFGGGRMLPLGRLREPLTGLGRAGAIVLTRCDLVSEGELAAVRERIRRFSNAPVFESRGVIGAVRDASDGSVRPSGAELRPFAFCGLGNPDAFFGQCHAAGIRPAGTRTFRDHHRYSSADAASISAAARTAGADSLLTTRKDAVKLSGLDFDLPLLVADYEFSISGEFEKLVLKV